LNSRRLSNLVSLLFMTLFLRLRARSEDRSAEFRSASSPRRLKPPAAESRYGGMSGSVQVFGRRHDEGYPRAAAAGVRKAPRHEVAGSMAPGSAASAWGSYVVGDLDGGRGASARRCACAHAGEPGRVQWTSRRAYGIHQRAVGGLMGGIGSRGGKPHGRMLPQLSRFGMNVAK
jgi:hypothetical protein